MRCSEHRDAQAGWRCGECKRLLCGECTTQFFKLFECGHCEAVAKQFTVPRVDKPFRTWAIDAIAYPLKNVVATLSIAVIISVLAWLEGKVLGAELAQVVVLASAALVVIVSAARRDSTGRPMMIGKAAATTGLLWVPITAYVLLSDRALNDGLAVLVAGLSAVYVPAALVTSATDVSIARGLNPFVIFEWIWRVKLRYVAFVVSAGLLAVAATKISTLTLGVSSERLVNEAATTVVVVALTLAACRMLGNFVFVHGDAFDFGAEEQYVDPMYPEIVATAGRKGKWGLGEDGDDRAARAVYGTGDDEHLKAQEIRRHVAKDETARALQLYNKRETWSDDAFNPKVLLDLGNAAAKSKDYDLAVALLTQVAKTAGTLAPRAMFRMARLYETSLDKRADAIALYQKIVDEHPTSDVARPSKQRLEEGAKS